MGIQAAWFEGWILPPLSLNPPLVYFFREVGIRGVPLDSHKVYPPLSSLTIPMALDTSPGTNWAPKKIFSDEAKKSWICPIYHGYILDLLLQKSPKWWCKMLMNAKVPFRKSNHPTKNKSKSYGDYEINYKLVGGWTNPFRKKYYRQIGVISPGCGVNMKQYRKTTYVVRIPSDPYQPTTMIHQDRGNPQNLGPAKLATHVHPGGSPCTCIGGVFCWNFWRKCVLTKETYMVYLPIGKISKFPHWFSHWFPHRIHLWHIYLHLGNLFPHWFLW